MCVGKIKKTLSMEKPKSLSKSIFLKKIIYRSSFGTFVTCPSEQVSSRRFFFSPSLTGESRKKGEKSGGRSTA